MLSCGIDLFCCYDGSTDCCSDSSNIFNLGTTTNITTIGYPVTSPTQTLDSPMLPPTSLQLPVNPTFSASSATISPTSSVQPIVQFTSQSTTLPISQSTPQPTLQSVSQSTSQPSPQITSSTTSQTITQMVTQTVSPTVSATVAPASIGFCLTANDIAILLSVIATMLAHLHFL